MCVYVYVFVYVHIHMSCVGNAAGHRQVFYVDHFCFGGVGFDFALRDLLNFGKGDLG